MSDDTLLKNLAGGGIGATVLGSIFLLYKCLQKRGLKSKSGCISFELTTPHDIQQQEHFHIEIPTSRTPIPSVNSVIETSQHETTLGKGLQHKATLGKGLQHETTVEKENVTT
jgi:hypothetical protein